MHVPIPFLLVLVTAIVVLVILFARAHRASREIQASYNTLEERYAPVEDASVWATQIRQQAQQQAEQLQRQAHAQLEQTHARETRIEQEIQLKQVSLAAVDERIMELSAHLLEVEDEVNIQDVGLYAPLYPDRSAADIQAQLVAVKARQKEATRLIASAMATGRRSENDI